MLTKYVFNQLIFVMLPNTRKDGKIFLYKVFLRNKQSVNDCLTLPNTINTVLVIWNPSVDP